MASQLLHLFNQAQREEMSCGINHIDVCTGMRLRYIEKNHSGAATLLMLHDVAEQSTVFIKVGVDDAFSLSLFILSVCVMSLVQARFGNGPSSHLTGNGDSIPETASRKRWKRRDDL